MKKLQKAIIRTEEMGANFHADGVSVAMDWRYDVLMDYLRHSHSFQAVRQHKLGKPCPYPLPQDYSAVEAVVDDFSGFMVQRERDWWDKEGKVLFGIKAPAHDVHLTGLLTAGTPQVSAAWQGIDLAVIEIPLHLQPSKALRQIKDLLTAHHQSAALNITKSIAPKYQLQKSKLHREKLAQGAHALWRYEQGMPLWKIGNKLRLAPASVFDEAEAEASPKDYEDHKKELATRARRLISFAALVAENAARGRFPSCEPFSEAMLNTYQRDAGRPKGSTKKK
jgi:hypothetical protein